MNNDLKKRNISPGFVLLFITFTLAWYIYVSSSSAFFTIVRIGDHIASNLLTQFLNPEFSQGLEIILMKRASPLREVHRILHLLSQFFIVVGILTSSVKVINVKFGKEYKAFALVNLALCLAGIAIPYFASSLNTTRLYHITLFFLAPFFVIGGIVIFNRIKSVSRTRLSEENMKGSLKFLSIFLAFFLLFTSGLIYEIAKDNPSSMSLDKTMYYPIFNDKEVHAAKWLVDVTDSYPIYADRFGVQLLRGFAYQRVRTFSAQTKELISESYLYLRSFNLKGFMVELNEEKFNIYTELQKSTFYNKVLTKKNRIYDNGGSEIYK